MIKNAPKLRLNNPAAQSKWPVCRNGKQATITFFSAQAK
jgi:hypothetical protein